MNTDDKTLEALRKIINEVKSEMSGKKVLSEGKTPEVVFSKHEKDMKKYIADAVFKALKDAEK